MAEPPRLDRHTVAGPPIPRSAFLINPFYPKDAHASFGDQVFTPTLALTSFAATSPSHWSVKYWDENLLHGAPPCVPLPADALAFGDGVQLWPKILAD